MIDESNNDLSKKAEMAFADACRGVIARAAFHNAPIIICRDGESVGLSPAEAALEFAKNTSNQKHCDKPIKRLPYIDESQSKLD